MIQRGFRPVLVDVDETLNIDTSEIERAIDGDTRGIVLAHALGNPADMPVIMDLAEHHGLFVLEDCCSAIGSLIGADKCGSFGLASTFSFNPTHGMTTGEGGAVLTGDADLEKIVRSMRDWGRECTCVRTGNASAGRCGRRFDVKLGDVEYDHRYIYSTVGYNLRPTEMQAAMGLVQLEKLEAFNKARRENYRKYLKALEPYSGHLSFPAVHEGAEPAWMGLPVILANERINRRELLLYLNRHRIETRLFFAGNVLLQPAYRGVEFIVKSSLSRTETVLKNCFWIGLHPGIDETVIDYVASVFGKFIKEKGL